MSAVLKHSAKLALLIGVCALVLSAVWDVPYVFTVIGFAAWSFLGLLITIDDDLPGGFGNPDGDGKSPWPELAIKAAVLVGLITLTVLVPTLQVLGA